ncbi:MAG: hypothetical protein KBC58_02350 [Flavobacterium sp.]|nr:hypothetical protein [Flavobacterium sp.]
MKLTTQQIERLYQFTRQHYVEWYDLQTELVDHLANSIETQWQENPKISFDDALKVEFKKFGVFGFMTVVEERQAALGKKYNKLVWQHFKSFFTFPKIIGTAAAFGILVQLMLKFERANLIVISIFVLATLFFWIGIIKMSRKNKKEAKLSGKKWLYKDIIFGLGSFTGFISLPLQFGLRIEETAQYGIISAIIVSVTVVCLFLLGYIILKIIPSKAEEYLKETYPEYALENAN